MSQESRLRELIRQAIVDEANATANIDGGEGPPKVPGAFARNKKNWKKRAKENNRSTGYTIVERIEDDDYKVLRDIIRVEIASLFFDLFKKRRVWI